MMIYSIYHDGLRSHKLDIDETAIDTGIDLISIRLCSFLHIKSLSFWRNFADLTEA